MLNISNYSDKYIQLCIISLTLSPLNLLNIPNYNPKYNPTNKKEKEINKNSLKNNFITRKVYIYFLVSNIPILKNTLAVRKHFKCKKI